MKKRIRHKRFNCSVDQWSFQWLTKFTLQHRGTSMHAPSPHICNAPHSLPNYAPAAASITMSDWHTIMPKISSSSKDHRAGSLLQAYLLLGYLCLLSTNDDVLYTSEPSWLFWRDNLHWEVFLLSITNTSVQQMCAYFAYSAVFFVQNNKKNNEKLSFFCWHVLVFSVI